MAVNARHPVRLSRNSFQSVDHLHKYAGQSHSRTPFPQFGDITQSYPRCRAGEQAIFSSPRRPGNSDELGVPSLVKLNTGAQVGCTCSAWVRACGSSTVAEHASRLTDVRMHFSAPKEEPLQNVIDLPFAEYARGLVR